MLVAGAKAVVSTQNVHLKNLFFFVKSKTGVLPVFVRKTNSFRRLGEVMLANRSRSGPIGTPATLKWPETSEKPGNLGPKVPQIVRFLTGRFFKHVVQVDSK
jgi:hypothetical protein